MLILHHKYDRIVLFGILLILNNFLFAQTPLVENVRFEQRIDGSLKVDIWYDVTTVNDLPLEVIIEASDDDGASWDLNCSSLSGDVGAGVSEGKNKHVIWDFYTDNQDTSGLYYKIQVTAHCLIIGQVITEDFTLTRDLYCTGDLSPVISIRAPNVTLDLGGHTIYGDIKTGSVECIIIDHAKGANVRNGTIDGFVGGVIDWHADSATIENVTIKNLDIADPDIFITGLSATSSRGVIIRNCNFEFLKAFHKEAIIMGSSNDFLVDGIEVRGGSVGVNFGGHQVPSNGIVKNCDMLGLHGAGVLVQITTNGLIVDNTFDATSCGVKTDAVLSGEVTGLVIENNLMKNCDFGVLFLGTIESRISGNELFNNEFGIVMDPQMGCPRDGPYDDCFFSTANFINDNVALNNEIDLYHHEKCTGNTWESNTFESSQGIEIFTGESKTALQAYTFVDTLARKQAPGTRLVFVVSEACDSVGISYKWAYHYESSKKQKNYEFWYQNGNALERGSWDLTELQLPISKVWIDSDSAVKVADESGGNDFKKIHNDVSITMQLRSEWVNTVKIRPVWDIQYRSESSGGVSNYVIPAGPNTPFDSLLNTTTAREVLNKVDSTAKSVAADAQLIFISGGPISPFGKGYRWGYLYNSVSQNKRYEFRVEDGELEQLDKPGIVWIDPDQPPIPMQFIDSDLVVAEAEENGGKEYRDTHEDATIEMDLQSEIVNDNEIQSRWFFRYRSESSGEVFLYDVLAGPAE